MSQPKATLINAITGEMTPGTPLQNDRYVTYTLSGSCDGCLGGMAWSGTYSDLAFAHYTIYGLDQYSSSCWNVFATSNDGAETPVSNTDCAQAGDCTYADCDGVCFGDATLEWLNDAYCDEGTYGIDFACEAWDCDNGGCEDACGVCLGTGPGFQCWGIRLATCTKYEG
jgi:hypothetical protein